MILKLILVALMLCVLGLIFIMVNTSGFISLIFVLIPSLAATHFSIQGLNKLTNNWFITDINKIVPTSLKTITELDTHTILSNIAIYGIALIFMTICIFFVLKFMDKEAESVMVETHQG